MRGCPELTFSARLVADLFRHNHDPCCAADVKEDGHHTIPRPGTEYSVPTRPCRVDRHLNTPSIAGSFSGRWPEELASATAKAFPQSSTLGMQCCFIILATMRGLTRTELRTVRADAAIMDEINILCHWFQSHPPGF